MPYPVYKCYKCDIFIPEFFFISAATWRVLGRANYPANCIFIKLLQPPPQIKSMPKPANYKLVTTFHGPENVTHTTFHSDVATGVRMQPVQTKWTTTKTLGSGAQGSVLLQAAQSGQLRAVKKLEKFNMGIDVELKVMSKVANVFFPPCAVLPPRSRCLTTDISSIDHCSWFSMDGMRMTISTSYQWNTCVVGIWACSSAPPVPSAAPTPHAISPGSS